MVNSGRKYVTYFDLMKLRCFTKLLEANEFLFTDNGDRVACGLRLGQITLGSSTKLFYYVNKYYPFESLVRVRKLIKVTLW